MTNYSQDKNIKKSDKYGSIFEEKLTEKRKSFNPYIEKVLQNKNILTNEELIFSHAGKWSEYFGNNHPLVLEIGTGMGNYFSDMVSENPEKNFLGVEIKYKRLHTTDKKSKEKIQRFWKNPDESVNYILLKTKGQNIVKFLADSELHETYIFFPDPWGKKDRQKKHRIFQEEFIKDLFNKTKKGGKLYFKTDHREYFDTTIQLFKNLNLWKIDLETTDYEKEANTYDKSKKTEFEVIFDEKKICYAEFSK